MQRVAVLREARRREQRGWAPSRHARLPEPARLLGADVGAQGRLIGGRGVAEEAEVEAGDPVPYEQLDRVRAGARIRVRVRVRARLELGLGLGLGLGFR